MDSKCSSLVRASGNDAATEAVARIGADDYGATPVLGVVPLFDRRVKGVHVDMKDAAIRRQDTVEISMPLPE